MSSAYSAPTSATPKAAANGTGSYPPVSGAHASAAAAARHQHHLHFHRMRHRFSLTNILGDPFALSTISIGSIGWVVALCGSITVSTTTSKFPVFTWWGVASQFLVIIAVFWVCATNNVHPYRLALLASLATTTVYTTNSTNNFVYNSTPSSAAASAGFILLSIINILWMIYFGTTEEAPLHRFVDSYSVNKPVIPYDSYYHDPMDMGYTTLNNNNNKLVSGLSRQQTNPFSHSAAAAQSSAMATGINAGINTYGQQQQRGAYSDNANNYNKYYTQDQQNSMGAGSYGMDVLSQPTYHQQQSSFMAAPLGAFENSSQIHHKSSTASGVDQSGYGTNNALALGGTAGGYRESQASSDGEVSLPTEYPYRVRANYSYVATDENELSFKKDEILEVNEIRGKWWQARRENGEIGICPSNYVRLLNYGWGAAAIAAGLVGPDGMAHYVSTQQQQSGYDSMTTTTSTTTGYHQNL